MRWMLLPIWVAVTAVLVIVIVSDSLFAKKRDPRLGMRFLLCLVWPIALLTRTGREVLFKNSEGL